MRVFIQSSKNDFPHNETIFNAYAGFQDMGAEFIHFHDYEVLHDSKPEDIVVGYKGTIKNRLYQLGFETPELDYPKELTKYLGRKIWKSDINTICAHHELWPVFVKSYEVKRITGKVIRSIHDLVGCGESGSNAVVHCSDAVNFLAEWRVFVRYGKILDVRPYKGDWREHFDPKVIENCVNDYKTIPAGCAIDFGVTDDGRTLLVEVNDGYALGCYGLNKYHYAKLLAARWAELTQTEDQCNFE